MAPRPITVVRTGASRRRASARSSVSAPAAITPPPARTRGRLAARRSRAASAMSATWQGGRRPYPPAGRSPSTRAKRKSFGIETAIGPGRPVLNRSNPPLSVRAIRSEEHTSELQSRLHLVCRLLLEKKKQKNKRTHNHHQNRHR